MTQSSSFSRFQLRSATPFLLLCLVACASQAPVSPRPFEAPPKFKEAGPWKPAQSAEVPANWWQVFADPVLNDLQDQLLLGNENLKSAVAQLANARALLQASQAALWPSLSLNATGARAGSPGTGGGAQRVTANTVSLGASAAWELDLWGRLSKASQLADAKFQASRDDLAAARLSAQATLTQSYLALRAAEAQLALQERNAAAYQRSLDLTRARLAAGVVAQSDVLQAQIQLKTVQAQIAESRAQRAQFEHAIAVLLGRAPAALTIAPLAELPTLPEVPELVPARLLERRPDIASAERNVAAALAQIGVADAAFFPDLSLSASAAYRGASLGNLVNASNLLWSFGPNAALAILDSGSRQLASSQARAAAEQAVASYRQTVLLALQEVEDNLVLHEQLAQELRWQSEALAAAQRNLEITQAQYQAGTVSYLNVTSAQTAALLAESNVLSLRNRQLAAANVLLKNLGGSWQNQPE